MIVFVEKSKKIKLTMVQTLDLHGYKIEMTAGIVDSYIYDQILYGNEKVQIMTGASKTIKNIVIEVIDGYGLNYDESSTNESLEVYL